MDLFLQFTINGVVAGGIYAFLAVGFAMTYNITRIFHVAHGAMFSIAAYALYAGMQVLGLSPAPAVVLAVAVAVLAGIGVEVWCYRPLRRNGASLATLMIASFGVFIILQNVLALFFGQDELFVRQEPLASLAIGPLFVTSLHLVVVGAGIVIFLLLHFFLTRSMPGKSILALADNADLAATIGIHTNRQFVFVGGLSAGLAGLAAMFVSFDTGLSLSNGFSVLLIAAVAVIVGGVGDLLGAGIGAFLLGLAQNWAVWKISSEWQDTVVFVVLGLFLIFRPQGILGARLSTRTS